MERNTPRPTFSGGLLILCLFFESITVQGFIKDIDTNFIYSAHVQNFSLYMVLEVFCHKTNICCQYKVYVHICSIHNYLFDHTHLDNIYPTSGSITCLSWE